MPHETIIESEIPFQNGTVKVTIDHLLDIQDDEEQYTGCYRVTLGNGQIFNVELGPDAIWIETGNGPTELSREVGKLIENYTE